MPLKLDPKIKDTVWGDAEHSERTDGFADDSWGISFERFRDLRRLVLELETREGKRGELDAIVERADGWGFPLGERRELVLDGSQTRRTGWVRRTLCEFDPRSFFCDKDGWRC